MSKAIWLSTAGMTFLLGWREITPWLSGQLFPIIAFRRSVHR